MSTSPLDHEADAFFSWFQANGGQVDSDGAVGMKIFPDTGRGACALRDIPVDETLFEIPRDLILSTRTSVLPGLLGPDDWKTVGDGWAGLILCMMWEEARGAESKWSGYFADMPSTFSTPMFWSPEELKELEGSIILEKIGKSEAETDYNEKVLPLLKRRPDLFQVDLQSTMYAIERYHINGSRILSRSFHVEVWAADNDPSGPTSLQDNIDPEAEHGRLATDAMDEDGQQSTGSSDSEQNGEDTADVSMTPLADLLNARHGCDNARLFYERDSLKMISTRPISAGSQIWNTYGNPPNSDLLRRYGHVDLVPTPDGLGNPADVVEIKADLVVEIIKAPDAEQRVEFFLDEGGEDIFVIEAASPEPPEELISFIRLLLLSSPEFQEAREKEKLPKPNADMETCRAIVAVLERRLAQYPTSIETDEASLDLDLTPNVRNAVIVRLGEKKILRRTLLGVADQLDNLEKKRMEKKRKREPPTSASASSSKKHRR